MNVKLLWLGSVAVFVVECASQASVKATVERRSGAPNLAFTSVPAPATNDAAATAKFTLVDGTRDRNSGSLAVLHDGRIPTGEDQPSANFFFAPGTDGGRLTLDLGKVIAVKQVNTYSWHPDTRAPQGYRLYASDGTAEGFGATPKRGTDPASCGWTLVASVDTRSEDGNDSPQHGVTVADSGGGALGRYRFFLFDISQTEDRDPFGNTFFCEIDVLDAEGPAPIAATSGADKPVQTSFEAEDGKYRFTIDATAAPDLMEWADKELRPVVQTWYPKLVAMLPSEGFVARTNLTLRFRSDMAGTPASTSGGVINMNSDWFRGELRREARGAVVHEMVHVVQNYGRARRVNSNATRTPGWLVEGIADYIRWFLYEPETRGAEITARNLARARHDASYRITGNFLNWVTQRYDPELVRKLNVVAREGNYTEELWKKWTGKTLAELGDEWKREHERRLANTKADQNP